MVGKPHISAARVSYVEGNQKTVGPLWSSSRLNLDDNLQRRVESVEQPAKLNDPADAIGLGSASKAKGSGPDHNRAGGTVPEDCRRASHHTYGAY